MPLIKYSENNIYITDKTFSPEQTLDCGQAFRFRLSDGIWSGVAAGRLVKLKRYGSDTVILNMSRREFERDFMEYFSFDVDYTALIERFSRDKTLKKACEFASGIHILKQDKWETICSFIISANNNIPRIKGIIDRLCRLYGERLQDDCYLFPSPYVLAELTAEDLAPVRAGFRAKYIIGAARCIAENKVDLSALETLDINCARDCLMTLPGVGPKVAECVLLFSCARFEAFPEDVWIKRVMAELYPHGLPECTAGYEGIAQQYLFHYARHHASGGSTLYIS